MPFFKTASPKLKEKAGPAVSPHPPSPRAAPGESWHWLAMRPSSTEQGGESGQERGQYFRRSSTDGAPLEASTRTRMQATLGADFSHVRVHQDDSAQRLGAHAYTVGEDLHFAPGRYQPGTLGGDSLIGHELTHVLQQRAGRVAVPQGSGAPIAESPALEAEADRLGHRAAQGMPAAFAAWHPSSPHAASAQPAAHAPIQRQKATTPSEWHSSYGPAPKARVPNIPYAEYKEQIGEVKAASSYGGTRKGRIDVPVTSLLAQPSSDAQVLEELKKDTRVGVISTEGDFWKIVHNGKTGFVPWMDVEVSQNTMGLTLAQFFEIFPLFHEDAKKNPDIHKKAEDYCGYVNDAFATMQIDTIEAQADYLAHASVESGQFTKLREAMLKDDRFIDDPMNDRLDKSYLEAEYPKVDPNNTDPKADKRRLTIDPGQLGEWMFIGRGPVQVTHRGNYIQTLAYMEKQAEQHAAAGNTAQAERLREAVAAIKADPRAASNARYTFIFSAAFMQMTGGVDLAGKIGDNPTFSGTGVESKWVTGGHREVYATDSAKRSLQEKKVEMKRSTYERALFVLGKGAEPKKKGPKSL